MSANLKLYNKNSQIEISTLTIKKPLNGSLPVDILSIMDQFILFEDMYQLAMSAKLIFRDQINLVGTFPIVGGEIINIRFKTPVYTDWVNLEFVVYEIGERGLQNGPDNIQINQLYLCTPEVWWAANNDISASYQGTYSDIIETMIKDTGTKKKVAFKEPSIGVVNYVAPMWNTFKAVKFCAKRANTQTMSPLFFWETTDGYHIKSLKEIYRAKHDKIVYIEDRAIIGGDKDPSKVFNTLYQFDYRTSNNRLEQFNNNAFGADVYTLDPVNKRLSKVNNSYDDIFNKKDIKLNKFPLNDDAKAIRKKSAYIPYRADLSHLTSFTKSSNLSLMDNLKVLISIPGDSNLKTGDIVWMDIPAKVAVSIDTEKHSSGKWLVRSIKHLIQKTRYSQTCELTKDSFDSDVIKKG